jgi:RNase P subunit RPR2
MYRMWIMKEKIEVKYMDGFEVKNVVKEMLCKNCMSDGEWEYIEEWVDEGERFVLVMCMGCGREEIWEVE